MPALLPPFAGKRPGDTSTLVLALDLHRLRDGLVVRPVPTGLGTLGSASSDHTTLGHSAHPPPHPGPFSVRWEHDFFLASPQLAVGTEGLAGTDDLVIFKGLFSLKALHYSWVLSPPPGVSAQAPRGHQKK